MTKPYQVLLVDDEYLALELLENYLQHIPNVSIVDKCKSPLRALEILRQQQVDILFLDVQMPSLSGVDLLKTLDEPPLTIFTTAYRDYAVEAFDLSAVDYLVKPFSLSRFLQAFAKAQQALLPRQEATLLPSPEVAKDYFTVKVDSKLVRIRFAEVQYVEGLKEYVRIVTVRARYVTYERMKRMEGLLPVSDFVRVHKSYIVGKQHVKSLEGNLLEVGVQHIPISRGRREMVINELFV